jgi:hypothetical protein
LGDGYEGTDPSPDGSHRDDGLERAIRGTVRGWSAVGLGHRLRLRCVLLLRAPAEHLERRDDDLSFPVTLPGVVVPLAGAKDGIWR